MLAPRTALMLKTALAASPVVVALKVAVVAPEEIVTVAGIVNAGFGLERVTTAPLGPAGPFSVTVPTELAPPATDAGDIEIPVSFAALIVKV